LSREIDRTLLSRGFFFHGRIEVWQYRRGFRFALDAPLLASFLEKREGPALEVGSGCGIVSLLAAYRRTYERILALEIQPELAALAEFNVSQNRFSASVEVRQADFRDWQSSDSYSAIFSNPPYYPLHHGHVSPDRQKRIARCEETLTLGGLLEKSVALLRPDGELNLILPFFRKEEALRQAGTLGLCLARKRLVKPFTNAEPERVLLRFTLQSAKESQEEPLVVFERDREYSAELQRILAGEDRPSESEF
jgi:tRNA1(Val) A37 N6-methylase TrmN6